jgi:hypothetical protein
LGVALENENATRAATTTADAMAGGSKTLVRAGVVRFHLNQAPKDAAVI